MLKRSIQGLSSWNWKALVPVSKPVKSGIVTRKPSTEPMSASQRAICALRSEPVAKIAAPNRIGIQIARLSQGVSAVIVVLDYPMALAARGPSPRGAAPVSHIRLRNAHRLSDREPEAVQPQAQDHQQADDHHERILINEAGLEQAHDAGEHAYRLGRAVDQQPVNEADVAAFPQALAEQHGAVRKDLLVEVVEAVLVLENADQRCELLAQHTRQIRTDDVEVPRRHETGD